MKTCMNADLAEKHDCQQHLYTKTVTFKVESIVTHMLMTLDTIQLRTLHVLLILDMKIMLPVL